MTYRYFHPQKVLTAYEQQFGVSGHNQNSSLSFGLNQMITLTRTIVGDHFGWNGKSISFQPSAFFSWGLALQTLKSLVCQKIYCTNPNQLLPLFKDNPQCLLKDHQLIYLTPFNIIHPVSWIERVGDNQAIAIVINDWDQKCSFQQLTTLLAATKKLPIKPVIIIDCSYFFYEDLKEISSYLSALIFDPYCIFHLSGIVVVGISEQLQGTIKPVILGGGAGHPLTENHYQTNQYPQGMEAGTGNYPKIYLLQHYFAYYAKHFQDIVQSWQMITDHQATTFGHFRYSYYDHDQLVWWNYNQKTN